MCTIAIYERDDLMHSLLREWLTAAGYSVRGGAGGTRLRPAEPSSAEDSVDLVVVSITSPRQGGEAAIRSVRNLHPKTPIIALSSQARSGLSSLGDTARALGVECLLAIPLTRRELLSAVGCVVGRPKGGFPDPGSPDPRT